jgi:hypothetical protein
VSGHAGGGETRAEVVASGWMAPTLDASRVEAETVRHDIGPFNLYDELLAIEFEHRGYGEHGALEVLDDCQRAIVSLHSRPGTSGLQAVVLASTGPEAAAGPGGDGWLRTSVVLAAGHVSITTLGEGETEANAWFEGDVIGLEVAAALALRLGGAGDLALRRVRVAPRRAR